MKSIHVIIADDHLLFAEGLEQIIKSIPNYEVIDKVTNGKQLLQKLNNVSAQLILLDIHMPEVDGIMAAKQILLNHPDTKVIFISMFHSPKMIEQIRSMGAHGFIMKDVTADILKDSISKIYNGEKIFLEPQVKNITPNNIITKNNIFNQYKITEREIEVIQLIKEGLSSKQIADRLELSNYTIETHRKNIYRKLQVQNTAELLNTFERIIS